MRYKNNKKIVIINTIAIFLAMFLFSFIYEKFPNFLTAALFPVNESLFEHLKLMYVTQVLISLITFLVLKLKKIKINNYFFALLLTTIFNIVLFFIIYLPIYNRFGENLIFTMGLYLVTLSISEYMFYLITVKLQNKDIYNAIGILLLPLIWCSLVFLTFNPLRTDFFYDPIEEKYGIY